MSVIRITDSNSDSHEAVVEITIPIYIDGKIDREEYILKTFCQPFCYPAADFSVALYGFGVDNIWVENSFQKPIKTDCGYFSYRLSAQVVDAAKRHVKLGEYDFFLDMPFPKDVNNGSVVSFDVQRVDTIFIIRNA